MLLCVLKVTKLWWLYISRKLSEEFSYLSCEINGYRWISLTKGRLCPKGFLLWRHYDYDLFNLFIDIEIQYGPTICVESISILYELSINNVTSATGPDFIIKSRGQWETWIIEHPIAFNRCTHEILYHCNCAENDLKIIESFFLTRYNHCLICLDVWSVLS